MTKEYHPVSSRASKINGGKHKKGKSTNRQKKRKR
tara:strand:+ start:453 stop:557 length:105 start_codon:yes stop_codon:yes gene_type:complete